MKMFISFVVCMIVAPGLFMVHLAGAFMVSDGDYSLLALATMIAPLPLAMLLHIVYPLHKVDEAFENV